MSFYEDERGLLNYDAGVGCLANGEAVLVLSIEADATGCRWAHVLRLRHVERVHVDAITVYRGPLPGGGHPGAPQAGGAPVDASGA